MLECIALAGGELTDRFDLALAVAVEGDLAGVAAVLDDHYAKRATFRIDSARRPLARTPVTKRAVWVAWVASASLRCASTATPPKGSSWSSALRNYAGPQHFCLFRGMCSAWVPGSVLGCLASGDRAFSSGSALASPGFRGSFVLRDPGHIKGQLRATRDRYAPVPATATTVAPQKAKRRSSEYVNAPAASALTPTAAVVRLPRPTGRGCGRAATPAWRRSAPASPAPRLLCAVRDRGSPRWDGRRPRASAGR